MWGWCYHKFYLNSDFYSNKGGEWHWEVGKKGSGNLYVFCVCEMVNIQVSNGKVSSGKQLYLNPLFLWACRTHGLTSPLVFQKWRETFPLLLGTYGHVWTVPEAAGCAETRPNCCSSVSPQCFQGDRTKKLILRFWGQCEEHKGTSFLPTHFATLPLWARLLSSFL